jgi:hypothetical protein
MPLTLAATIVLGGVLAGDVPPTSDVQLVPRLEREGATTPKRHPVRAVLETTFAFAFNVAWYQLADRSFNAPDWDLRWDWDSWRKKAITFEAVRLDSNRFSTNAGSHTEGGTLVYLIGRGNGLGPAGSTALALGEVVVWEYVAEYAEKPSVNDLLNNPLGGFAVGEPFFQLSEFFARSARNGFNRTLAGIFSPLSPVNEWVDGRPRGGVGHVDDLGLTRDVTHRFDLYVGLNDARWQADQQRTETLLGIRTHLNTIPGYGSPVSHTGFFGTGRITHIDAALDLGHEGITGALFGTRVALGGYHWQGLWRDEAGDVRGNSVIAGLFNSFEYNSRQRPLLPYDQIATFGLVGPTLDMVHRHGAVAAQLRLEALPDLAMVTSLAGDRWKASNGSEGIKTELAERGYYYGYGLTLGSQLALRYHDFSAGVDNHWERFGSVDVLDRHQEQLTRNFHLVDGRLRSLVWVTLRPLASYAELGLALERLSRFGTIEDVEVSSVEERATVTLAIVF